MVKNIKKAVTNFIQLIFANCSFAVRPKRIILSKITINKSSSDYLTKPKM